MKIARARFIGGMAGPDPLLDREYPHVAFIGRSNVGKSSIINTLTKVKNLAKTSSFPGRTQQINLFLVNESFYLVDLPGYGFARLSKSSKEKINQLIKWYLFDSGYEQRKIVLIIDAYVGLTESDQEMLESLNFQGKDIIVVLNKTDKIKKSGYKKQIESIVELVGNHPVIPFSVRDKRGVNELTEAISK